MKEGNKKKVTVLYSVLMSPSCQQDSYFIELFFKMLFFPYT